MILLPRETVDALKPEPEPERGEFVSSPSYSGQGVVRGGTSQRSGGLLSDLAGIGRRVPQGVRDAVGSGLRDFTSAERLSDTLSGYFGETDRPGTLGGFVKERTGLALPPIPGFEGRRSGTRLGEAAEATGIPGARAAFDVGLAPATWVTAGIGPGTQAAFRGLPLAARAPLNLIAPASRSANFGVRLGAETAIGTAATVGAQETAERTDNPWLIAGAGLGTGILGSGAVSAAPRAGRAFGRVNALDDAATLARRAGPAETSTRGVLRPVPSRWERTAMVAEPDPPLAEGYTRMWRGENYRPPTDPMSRLAPDEIRQQSHMFVDAPGRWFSDSKEYAQDYTRAGGGRFGGTLYYVDVPTSQWDDHFTFAGSGAEFIASPEAAGWKVPLNTRYTGGDLVEIPGTPGAVERATDIRPGRSMQRGGADVPENAIPDPVQGGLGGMAPDRPTFRPENTPPEQQAGLGIGSGTRPMDGPMFAGLDDAAPPAAAPHIGFLGADGTFVVRGADEAEEAGWHHNFLFDADEMGRYNADSTLRFVKNFMGAGKASELTIEGAAATNPTSAASARQISTLAKRLIESGESPDTHLHAADVGLSGKSLDLGPLSRWVGDRPAVTPPPTPPVAAPPAAESSALGRVTMIDPRTIKTRPDLFQNRDELDAERVKNLVERWDPNQLDPLRVVRDKRTGELIVTTGHHRLAASLVRGEPLMPANILDLDLANPAELSTARADAALGNLNAKSMNVREQYRSYVAAIESGYTVDDLKSLSGTTRTRIQAVLDIGEAGPQVLDRVVVNRQLEPIAAAVGAARRRWGFSDDVAGGWFSDFADAGKGKSVMSVSAVTDNLDKHYRAAAEAGVQQGDLFGGGMMAGFEPDAVRKLAVEGARLQTMLERDLAALAQEQKRLAAAVKRFPDDPEVAEAGRVIIDRLTRQANTLRGNVDEVDAEVAAQFQRAKPPSPADDAFEPFPTPEPAAPEPVAPPKAAPAPPVAAPRRAAAGGSPPRGGNNAPPGGTPPPPGPGGGVTPPTPQATGSQSRTGLLTSLPDNAQLTAQLGRAPEIRDIFQIDRVGRREVTSVANRLRSQAELDFKALGRTGTEKGNIVLRGVPADAADTARGYRNAPLVKVLEKPSNYPLTPDQLAAANRLGSVPKAIADERSLAGVAPRLANPDDFEQFMWRKARVTSKGVKIDSPTGVGAKLGGGGDKSRVFADVDDALEAGVQYAHPLEAFDQNVTRGLKKVVDARVKALYEPLSETAAQRVSPGLRAKHDGLVQRLTSLKATGGRLDSRIAGIVDAYTNSAAPDIDALFDELENVKVGLNAVGKAGPNFGKSAAQMRKEIATVQQEIARLRPEWRREIRLSQQVPAGRATVPLEVAPGLAGRDFDPRIAQRIEDYYRRNARIRLPGTDKSLLLRADIPAVRVVSALLTPIKATGDLSALLSNNITNVARHPIMFAKNVALGMRDLVDDANYNRWLASGVNEDAARSGVAIAGPAGEALEFQLSNWMERIPVPKRLNSRGSIPTPILAGVNNHYTRFNNRMRVDMFNQEVARRGGATLDEATKEGIARSVNRFTGVSNSRATDAETLASFAPNFTRAHVESVAKALTDGTIEGTMAREHLATMLAAGGTLVLGAAVAQGRDPSEVLSPFDMDDLKRGRLTLNPNFMSVRVFGQDVKVFGKYDSLFRLMTVVADAGLRAAFEKDPLQLFDAIGYYTGSQGSPPASWLTAVVMGETFNKNSPTSPAGLLEQVTPISAPNVAKSLSEGNFGAAAVQTSGAKAFPLSLRERIEADPNLYDTLRGEEQLEGIPANTIRVMSTHKEIPEDIREAMAEAGHIFNYRQAVYERMLAAAKRVEPTLPESAQIRLAEKAMEADAGVKLYNDLRNVYENQWVKDNPDLANRIYVEDKPKPRDDKRLSLTDEDFKAIIAGVKR